MAIFFRSRNLIKKYAEKFGLSLYEAIYHVRFVGIEGLEVELYGEDIKPDSDYFAETGEECYQMLRSSGATIAR